MVTKHASKVIDLTTFFCSRCGEGIPDRRLGETQVCASDNGIGIVLLCETCIEKRKIESCYATGIENFLKLISRVPKPRE
jgi:hypothetical protein